MIDKKICDELKILSLEMINNAGSGHSGSVLSSAEILYTLYTRHLLSDERRLVNRDRFVLSNGHACAILYSILSGLEYFDLKELKHFRQYGGLLSGHPEIDIPGIDASTGPLGQGIANAVGMAIAETVMDIKFHSSHYTYCMVGDGCLEEGVGLEALSIAGLYGLNKFVLLYDKNDVTLDGRLEKSNTDDMVMKFRSMNFNVIECDGHDIEKIDRSISEAKKSNDKPTVIIFHTIIGKDSSLAGSNLSHGKVFDTQEIDAIKAKLNVCKPYLSLSDETKTKLLKYKEKIVQNLNIRVQNFENYIKNDAKLRNLYQKFIKNNFSYKVKEYEKIMSTRQANGIVLNDIARSVENLLVLSADLSSSTKVRIENGGDYSKENRLGKNIAVGIREHAMGAIANGIALHGGFNVICSTFLTFSNYMLPAIRMASIMKLNVLFTFTHSSIYDTPDGITHLPVEQLDQLRLIPDMIVTRPFNAEECEQTYRWYFELKRPICMCLSRGNIQYYPSNEYMSKGAYLLTHDRAEINIMASGSEISLAMEVKDRLGKDIKANVISMLSIEMFEHASAQYKKKIQSKPLFVIESGTCVKYLKYTDEKNIFSVHEFGTTGDEASLKKKYGYTSDAIASKIKRIVLGSKSI